MSRGMAENSDVTLFQLSRAVALVLFVGNAAVSGSAQASSCDVVKDGLVACYSFDGNVNDATGNGNNGSVNGATLTSDRFGNTNSAYKFNGNGDSILIPNSPTLNPAALTVSVWVNVSSSAPMDIVSKDGESFERQYLLLSGGNFRAHIGKADGNFDYADGQTPILAGKWYHLVQTYDGTELKMYVNGQHESSTTINVAPGGVANSDQPVRIGGGAPNSDHYWFHGVIDDVSIYNRSLSEIEIKRLYDPAQNCKEEHAIFNISTGLVSIPAIDIPTLDPFTGESTGLLATFSAQLNLLKGVEDFGLISDTFKVLQVDVTEHDPCHAEYTYADGKFSKGGIIHLPYVDVPSVIIIPPNVQVPGPTHVYDATLKQLALDLTIFHIDNYQRLGTLPPK
jgi:hypothetical protein